MAVRIRLKRVGRRHRPFYRVAVVDNRRARDSKVIEEVGTYQPIIASEEQQVSIKRERIEYWLGLGAQPSDTVRRLLVKSGIVAGAKKA